MVFMEYNVVSRIKRRTLTVSVELVLKRKSGENREKRISGGASG
jgi:hypothetical protein